MAVILKLFSQSQKHSSLNLDKVRIGRYKHYKNGKLYEVLDVAYNADNAIAGDPLDFPYVLYKQLGSESFWVRPHAQFNDELEYEGKLVNALCLWGELEL